MVSGVIPCPLLRRTQVSASSSKIRRRARELDRTGDFNGDGLTDILCRNSSATVAIWFSILGNPQPSPAGIANAPTVWSIVETGDFGGDGMSDILWQDTSGTVAIWFMFVTNIKQSAGVANVAPTVWSIQCWR